MLVVAMAAAARRGLVLLSHTLRCNLARCGPVQRAVALRVKLGRQQFSETTVCARERAYVARSRFEVALNLQLCKKSRTIRTRLGSRFLV